MTACSAELTRPARSKSCSTFSPAASPALDVDAATATLFARERSRLRRAGTPIGDFDLLIGATALRYNLTLLSNNRRHFQRISGLNLLSV